MKTRYKPSPELGAFLKKWREENGQINDTSPPDMPSCDYTFVIIQQRQTCYSMSLVGLLSRTLST